MSDPLADVLWDEFMLPREPGVAERVTFLAMAQAAREHIAKEIEAQKGDTDRGLFFNEDDGNDSGYFDYIGGLDDTARIARNGEE